MTDSTNEKETGNSECCSTTGCCSSEPTVASSSPQVLRSLVRQKYSEIAQADECCVAGSSCCGMVAEAPTEYTMFAEDYTQLKGYTQSADLKLGCGVPTEFAQISEGDVVVDLGSGAGNDAFVARALVGETGRVIGIDMTEPMIAKACGNAEKLGFKNVEFRLGEIEAMPLEEGVADVVISNCVLNLVPEKERAFAEIYRILKSGAHFSISDVVLAKPLPEGLQKAAELYAGCVSGASLKTEYLGMIAAQGFQNVKVQAEKVIDVPDAVLSKYLSGGEATDFRLGGPLILSITVYGEKPPTVL